MKVGRKPKSHNRMLAERKLTETALDAANYLADIVTDRKVRPNASRIKAAEVILAYALGKPAQRFVVQPDIPKEQQEYITGLIELRRELKDSRS